MITGCLTYMSFIIYSKEEKFEMYLLQKACLINMCFILKKKEKSFILKKKEKCKCFIQSL